MEAPRMRLIRVTVVAAFPETDHSADGVGEAVVEYILDGLEAEVVYTTLREQRDVFSGPKFFDEDGIVVDNIEEWQEHARAELEAWE